jgi:hypothetical protein
MRVDLVFCHPRDFNCTVCQSKDALPRFMIVQILQAKEPSTQTLENLDKAGETPTYSSEPPQYTKLPPSPKTPQTPQLFFNLHNHRDSQNLLPFIAPFLLLSPKVYPRSKPLLSCTASRILKNVNSLIFQKGVDANIKTIILFIK